MSVQRFWGSRPLRRFGALLVALVGVTILAGHVGGREETPAAPPAQESPERRRVIDEVKTLYHQGYASYTGHDLTRARETWLKGAGLARQIDYAYLEALVLHALAIAHCTQGAYRDSVRYGADAERLFRKAASMGRGDAALGFVSESLEWQGYAYLRTGDYSRVLEITGRGREIANRMHSPGLAALTMQLTGVAYLGLGRLTEARQHLTKALTLFEANADAEKEAKTLEHLASICNSLGEYRQAKEYLERAERRSKVLYVGVRAAQKQILGMAYYRLGQWAEAERLFRESLSLCSPALKDTLDVYQYPERITRAEAANNLGALYLIKGQLLDPDRLKDAERLLQEARAEFAEFGNKHGLADVYNNLGLLHMTRRELPEARNWFRRALELVSYRESRPDQARAQTLLHLAVVYSNQRDWPAALARCQEALALRKRIGNPAEIAEALVRRAVVYRETGRLPQAERDLRYALRLFEATQERQVREPVEIGAFQQANLSDLYAQYALLLLKQRRPEDALVMVERGRAQGLARLAARPPGALAERERERSRGLSSSPVVEARPATFADLRKIAARRPDTLFLNWSRVDDATTLLFALSRRDGLQSYAISRSDLRAKARRWRRFVKDQHALARDPSEIAAARQLYDVLLGPLEKTPLLAPGRYRRLVLVADGPLLEIPFAALPDRAHRRLIERYPLSSCAALAELEWPRPQRRSVGSLLCVVVPSALAPSSEDAAAAEGGAGAGKARDEEQRRVTGGIPSAKSLRGESASEAEVKRRVREYALIHFATHGKCQGWDGLDSCLLLERDAESSDDGRLTAREVLSLPLAARLAVLSACETGQGRPLGGEGLQGLAWAFRAAGCRSVVASLWPVDGPATGDLMGGFYRGVRQGKRLDDALQDAVRQMRADPGRDAPYFWAAFQVIGDTAPVAHLLMRQARANPALR
jgi:CHAT domain-containing protein